MRILVAIAEMSAGGAERVVVELAGGLARAGDDVTVLAGAGAFDDALSKTGAERRFVPGRGRSPHRFASAAWRMRRALREVRPDVIHAHNVKATAWALTGRRLAAAGDVPVVTTFHGVQRDEYRVAAGVLRRADAIACVSRDLLEGLAAAGVPRGRMDVIHNSVPEPEPLAAAARARLDAELGLGDAPVVALVGRLVPQKAPQRFLRAVATLGERRRDLRFLVVGDGPLRPELELLARELGLGARVVFTGVRDDARELIARSELVVFSSEWEGMPMVALESLAAGVPIVTTDVEGMRELLAGGGGVVVDHDSQAIASAAAELLDDDQRRRELGASGQETVRREFGVERMVERYRALYARVAGALSS